MAMVSVSYSWPFHFLTVLFYFTFYFCAARKAIMWYDVVRCVVHEMTIQVNVKLRNRDKVNACFLESARTKAGS
jgi:hypothetical protein